jgi:dTDP-4-amino-4,6-dideoxygalactose transaminase
MSTSTYEREFARLLGVEHAIAFAYSRHGLIALLSAAGLRDGDEVILSPLTCKVVPLALLSLNLIPVYADVSIETLNLDPRHVESKIGRATRAVLFQHTYGNTSGIEEVAEIAAAKELLLFEDCAQCLPCAGGGSRPGRYGHGAVFSNNLRKPLPAGSGGVAVTNDAELAEKVRALRDRLPRRGQFAEVALRLEMWLHAHLLRPSLYWSLFDLSRKFRSTYKVGSRESELAREINVTALQASPLQIREGTIWLRRLEAYVAHRRLCTAEYAGAMRGLEALEMPCAGSTEPLYFFPVLVKRKEELLRKARGKRLELIAWPLKEPIYPVETESQLSTYGYEPGSCPVAETVSRHLIGLPTDVRTGARHRQAVIELLYEHHAVNGRSE